LWVKVPNINSSEDTILYIYFDNDKPDNTIYVGNPNSSPAENVWDSNFVFVSHMRDDPDTRYIRDSTGNNNDGTKKGANEPQVVTTGQIDDAQDFDGLNDYITRTSFSSVGTAYTIKVWIYLTKIGASQTIVALGDLYPRLMLFSNNKLLIYGSGNTYLWGTKVFGAGDLNKWWHITVVVPNSLTSTNWKIYLNGADDSGAVTNNNNGASPATLYWIGSRSGAEYFDGIIDETRISSDVCSVAWVKASYETQRDHLLSYGDSESVAGRPYGEVEEINRPYGEVEKL